MVQDVQTVQTVEALAFILPRALRYGGFAAYSGQPAIPSSAKHASRDAGEEIGAGLNPSAALRAGSAHGSTNSPSSAHPERVEGLNVSNELNVFS
jgi:hypothetical protein